MHVQGDVYKRQDTANGFYDLLKDIIIPGIGAFGGILSFWIAYKVYFYERKPILALDYDCIDRWDDTFNYDNGILREYLCRCV